MTIIYTNSLNWTQIENEVNFANYLVGLCFSDWFNHFRKPSELLKKYQDFFNKSHCIFIPKTLNRLNILEKHHLKDPSNFIKYPEYFSKYGCVISFENANLVNLNKVFSKYFETGYHGVNQFYILNSNKRLEVFEDVVLGIGSSKIRYLTTQRVRNIAKNLNLFILQLIQDVVKTFEKPENYVNFSTWYKLGTSAISLKSLK